MLFSNARTAQMLLLNELGMPTKQIPSRAPECLMQARIRSANQCLTFLIDQGFFDMFKVFFSVDINCFTITALSKVNSPTVGPHVFPVKLFSSFISQVKQVFMLLVKFTLMKTLSVMRFTKSVSFNFFLFL